MSIFLIFVASFFQVFLLGLNSQFVRDQQIVMIFMVSWCISCAQFTYTHIVAVAPTDEKLWLFFSSGWGGALGIVSSVYFYRWFNPKLHKWLEKRKNK